MSTTAETYSAVLDQLDPDWRNDPTDEGNAGAAVAVCVLRNGAWRPADITDFDREALSTAYQRLLDNGYIECHKGRWMLMVDEDASIDDGIWWALLCATAKGYLERSNKG